MTLEAEAPEPTAPQPGGTKPCPFCGEAILAVAKKCRHCRSYLDSQLAAENAWSPKKGAADASPIDRMLMPVARPMSAIAAGYMGLMAMFPLIGILFGILGISFGIRALKVINDDPELSGKGRAWFGIIAGTLFGVLWLIVLASIIVTESQRG